MQPGGRDGGRVTDRRRRVREADRADVVMGGISRAAPRSRPLLADVSPAGRSWPGARSADVFLVEVRPGGTARAGAGDEPGGAPAGAGPSDAPVGAVPVGRGRG